MTLLWLVVREFRTHIRRNALYGLVLLLAVGTQLVMGVTTAVSQEAVSTYSQVTYGYRNTWAVGDVTMSPQQIDALAATVDAASADLGEPLAVESPLDVALRYSRSVELRDASEASAVAVSGSWWRTNPRIQDSDAWRTVTSTKALAPGMFLSSDIAARLSATAEAATVDAVFQVTHTDDATQTASSAQPFTYYDAPYYGTFQPMREVESPDVIVGLRALHHVGASTFPVRIVYRCHDDNCMIVTDLVQRLLEPYTTEQVKPRRIDRADALVPVLEEQARTARVVSWIVIGLGGIAATILAGAFIEVRSPHLTMLRTLGVSRATLFVAVLAENVLTALVVALVATAGVAGVLLADPNVFNNVDGVRVTGTVFPWRSFALSGAITLGVGVLSGLGPAIHSYRSVRNR